MSRAHYEILQDDGSYYGEIPDCPGVYANANTLEECRKALADTLEGWLLFRIHKNLALPKIEGLELTVTTEASVR